MLVDHVEWERALWVLPVGGRGHLPGLVQRRSQLLVLPLLFIAVCGAAPTEHELAPLATRVGLHMRARTRCAARLPTGAWAQDSLEGGFLEELVLAIRQLRHGPVQSGEERREYFTTCPVNDCRCLWHDGFEFRLVVLLAGLPHVGHGCADVARAEIALEAAGEWADPFHGGMRGELLDAPPP